MRKTIFGIAISYGLLVWYDIFRLNILFIFN